MLHCRKPMNSSPQIMVPPFPLVVKSLVISSAVLFILQLALEQWAGFPLSHVLGFVPGRLLQGWIWQPFTYAFLHDGLLHLIFNLLILWTVGGELELLWGRVNFLAYCFVAALGAALFHGMFSLAGIGPGPQSPVIGSSGIVFGLLLAYGILMGHRVMYFFMVFPMPAKYFVMLIGAVELVSSVFYSKSGVAHLAHLGGMVFGFLFLVAMAQWRARLRGAQHTKPKKKKRDASHLKLVRSGDSDDDESGPIRWN